MWVKVEDEYVNLDMCDSALFSSSEERRQCVLYHGGKYTKITVNLKTLNVNLDKNFLLMDAIKTYIEEKSL